MDSPRRREGPNVLNRPARRSTAGSRPGEAPDRRPRADRARQVADLIRQQLLSVGFEDDLLPDERLLSSQLGATRNAVREALDLLRQEGLIERLPGVGTVVVGQKVPHDLHRLMGLGEVLHEHGTVVNEVRTVGAVRPPLGVAHRLGLAEDSSVVYIERLRRLNGLPLSLDLTYLTAEVGEPLLHADLQRHDIFQLIEQTSGHRLGAAELTVEAVNADPHSAAVLGVPRGAALLMVERLSHLEDGSPVDLEYIRFRGDRLVMRAGTHRSAPSGPPEGADSTGSGR
ncbi:MAG TPA: GntR family transcriptional regulator [Pseudonocardia sp.]|nr:GntR family transcriptional regulator [Pseudonocardia sp.]